MENKKPVIRATSIQPNSVTAARYDYSERQENILTMMIEAIQDHMTGKRPIETDLFSQPTVTIDLKSQGLEGNKAAIWKAAREMVTKHFEFAYVNREGHNEEVFGSIVSTVRNIKETAQIKITINQWAIPYLLYYGKGIGGTIFNTTIAIKLKGEYTKRLYKHCKRWEDKGGFSMSLEDFRKMLSLENKYPKLKDLKRWVLDPSIERMKKDADVYFSYSLEKVLGSRSYNKINFKILGNPRNKGVEKHKMLEYDVVYTMLSIPYDNIKSSSAQELCDKISQDPDSFKKLSDRMKKLREELFNGEKTREDLKRIIPTIIKEDYSEFQ